MNLYIYVYLYMYLYKGYPHIHDNLMPMVALPATTHGLLLSLN